MTLHGRVRGNLTTACTSGEVSIGLLWRNPPQGALNSHLAAWWIPVEEQRAARVRFDLVALAAPIKTRARRRTGTWSDLIETTSDPPPK